MSHLTQAEFARAMSVSKKTVTIWKQRGVLVLKDGKVDVAATNKALADAGLGGKSAPVKKNEAELPKVTPKVTAKLPDSMSDAETDNNQSSIPDLLSRMEDGAISAAEAQRIKEIGLARHHWLRTEVMAGNLIEVQAVKKEFFNIARTARDAWLSWPARVAPEMAARLGVDTRKMDIVLDEFVNKQLTEIVDAQLKMDTGSVS